VNSERRQDVMSHIIVRMDVVRDSRFVGTGMKYFDVSLSSFGRIFGTGSGADDGESNMRQVWKSALRYCESSVGITEVWVIGPYYSSQVFKLAE